jgi:PII-like signaling protein
MLNTGPALRVVIHLNSDITSEHGYLHNDILEFLYEKHVAGATVFEPKAGFGSHHRLHEKGVMSSKGQHLPVRVEFVDSREKVESLLPDLLKLVTDGMIEVQETTILKVANQAHGEDR